MTAPKVLIAGGSIGGLTTGALLRDLGYQVEIFERSSSALQDRGAGIVVLPITERYFEGAGDDDHRVSLELKNWTYVDRSGRQLSADPDRFRFSGWGTIYRALLEQFGPASYHYGHEAIGFEQDREGVRVILRDQPAVEGDLLVFADGFSSTGRNLLLPDVQPQYAGYVAWRGTVLEAHLSEEAQADLADAMLYQVLDGGHILVYAIPGQDGSTEPPNRIINFVWYRNYPSGGPFEDLMRGRDGRVRSGTMPPGEVRDEHLAEIRESASEQLAPTIREVVLECDDPLIQAIFDIESPQMAFERVCLLGDAATTLRPHIAAGQAKACADAWALRDAMDARGGNVIAALKTWEPRQLALAHEAAHRSRAMGIASQFEGTMTPGDPNWKFGLWGPGN